MRVLAQAREHRSRDDRGGSRRHAGGSKLSFFLPRRDTYLKPTEAAFTVSLMHAPSVSVTGPNPLEAPGAQTIEIQMDPWDLAIGFSRGR